MNDTDEATRIFEDIVASRSTNGLNRTLVEVGDGGLLEGYFAPEDGQDTGAYVHFHHEAYLVEMYLVGSLTTRDMCLKITQAQVARF
jgi:hypothetical protein